MTSLTIRRTTTAFLAVVIAGSAALLAAPSARAASVTPWEPDVNSVGGLTFYDAAGHQITGGDINDQPLAAYVEGAATPLAGSTKATLYEFTPQNGSLPTAWSGTALGASPTYPNSAAPAPLKTSALPLYSSGASDITLAQYVSAFPSHDTAAPNVYQLRLYTSGGPHGTSTKYDSADIQITYTDSPTDTQGTWQVVYPVAGAPTTTSLAVTPSAKAAYHGTSVKLTATVSPSAATGSIKFLDGTKVLKTVAIASGKATYSTTALTDAKHTLKATFVPTDSTVYATSTSAAHSLTVSAHPTKTTLKASKAKIAKGKKLTLTATETPAVAGKVTFFDGSKKLKTVAVKKGKATVSVTTLKVGTHKLKATFKPTNTANDGQSTSKTVKVKVTK